METSETTDLVRAVEAARRVGVPASTFRAWVRRGLIAPVTLPDGLTDAAR